ncbi:unnamed protein product [Fraxinus pennsylvanica]|uniref:AT3G52170-like helix-turn-helix domain-containing protein n=1 Tax=Fraxinus pennsylvanica TaxID=56036 RepID=A0AAD1ZCU8_9LAMI|nr:unnamed protein product [Fraxinus pennsylvanica]
MHVTKGGWAVQTFALAANDDSRGRKSRIRRSKEERKEMVESFINKYQKSNNGNFPSLNLTHKEVGGSFYTVREIVREIIQENKVLGPAKSFLKEHNNSEFLKHYPLGSISIQPQIDFSSDKAHAVIDITPDDHRVITEKHISISNGTFRGPESFALDNDVNGHSQAVQENKGSDEQSTKHGALIPQDTSVEDVSKDSKQFSQPKSQEFENEQIANTSVGPGNHQECDRQIFSRFSGEVSEPGTKRLSDEQILYVDRILERKTKEYEELVGMESIVRESTGREKVGAEELKKSEAAISPVNADMVMEKFPMRPLSTTHDADGGSSKSSDVTGALGYGATQHDRISFESFSGLINEKVDEKFPGSTMKGNSEFRDEKPLKHKGPSLESSNCCGTDEANALDIRHIRDVEVKHSLPDGTTASDSPEQLISTESTAVMEKLNISYDNYPKENNTISQETSEGTSKKTSAPETNSLWALLIAFLLAFVKFWTK